MAARLLLHLRADRVTDRVPAAAAAGEGPATPAATPAELDTENDNNTVGTGSAFAVACTVLTVGLTLLGILVFVVITLFG